MAFTWQPRELSCWLKKWLIFGNLSIKTVHVLAKVLFKCFWVPLEINSRFCSKSQWRMFLLVSSRHVGAHLDGHQHMASPDKSLQLRVKNLSAYLREENLLWPESWREPLHIYHLSFSSFKTFSIKRFWSLFWSILNGVAPWGIPRTQILLFL